MSLPTSNPIEIHSGITLKGELSVLKDIVLTGKFEGDLQTYGSLTVASGGMITGTIDAGGLILEPGNLVEARVLVRVHEKPKPAEEVKKSPGPSLWSGGLQKLKEMALGRK
jgi:hypothetical protein